MGRRKKVGIRKWEYLIWGLMLISGAALYYTNKLRADSMGGYFSDGALITWNSIAYVVFFGLVTGYVVGSIVSRANGRHK